MARLRAHPAQLTRELPGALTAGNAGRRPIQHGADNLMRYNATPGSMGSGQDESQLHPNSGLRLASAHYVVPGGVLTTSATWSVMAPASFGGASAANVITWTSVRGSTWNGLMPCPATPQVFIILGSGTTQSLRIRMTGYDQFGNHIIETSPWLSKTRSTSAYAGLITMSKVFSYVEDVEYMSIAVNNSSTIAVGLTGIMSYGQINATTEDYGDPAAGGARCLLDHFDTLPNYGFGTPLKIVAYSSADRFDPPGSATLPLDPDPWKDQELLQATQVTLRNYDGTTVTQGNTVTKFGVAKQQNHDTGLIGTRLGYSVSGWQGTPHKIGLEVGTDLQDGNTDTVTNGSSVAAHEASAGVGDVVGDINADDKEFFFIVRTALGTQARSNSTRYYPR